MNSCHFSGRLVQDAQIHYSANGTSVTTFRLACECGFGQYQRTEFLDFVKFKGEKLAPYLVKGKPITVINSEFQLRKWQDKEGQTKSKPQFIAGQIEFHLQDSTKNKEQQNNQEQQSSNQFMDDAPF